MTSLRKRLAQLEREVPRPMPPRVVCLRVVESLDPLSDCPDPCPRVEEALRGLKPGRMAFLLCRREDREG